MMGTRRGLASSWTPLRFEWMEQTWFPFLWHSPNAAGTVVSGVHLKRYWLLQGDKPLVWGERSGSVHSTVEDFIMSSLFQAKL